MSCRGEGISQTALQLRVAFARPNNQTRQSTSHQRQTSLTGLLADAANPTLDCEPRRHRYTKRIDSSYAQLRGPA